VWKSRAPAPASLSCCTLCIASVPDGTGQERRVSSRRPAAHSARDAHGSSDDAHLLLQAVRRRAPIFHASAVLPRCHQGSNSPRPRVKRI
jgi:hypothetical protein